MSGIKLEEEEMKETAVCKHCGAPVRRINYAMGEVLMHINPSTSFPTERNGGAWRYCHLQVAELEDRPLLDNQEETV